VNFINQHQVNNQQEFDGICPEDIVVVPWTDTQKVYMVDLHNYYRLQVAVGATDTYVSGEQEFFPSAARMMKLVWDDQESFLAMLNLKTCNSHDSCHNTSKYSKKLFAVLMLIIHLYSLQRNFWTIDDIWTKYLLCLHLR